MRTVLLPIAATLAVQSLMSMSVAALSVLAPVAALTIGMPVSTIGLYIALIYACGLVTGLPSGALVRRYGALRMSQIALVGAAIGIALTASGQLWLVVCGAMAIGLGSGPVTPASSHILNALAPPGRRTLVFSIKQTGVPIGFMLAGGLLPSLTLLVDSWRVAAALVSVVCLGLALALQPMRASLDHDRTPHAPFGWASVTEPLRLFMADRLGRRLALTAFFYVSMQFSLGAYLVAYLTRTHGYDLVQAGLMLVVAQVAGVVARIVTGLIADHSKRPVLILGVMGGVMGLCAFVAFFSTQWSSTALMLLYAVFGASAIGWNGVYLAEVARRAPAGSVGAATGAALIPMYGGGLCGPPVFALLLEAGMSYGGAFVTMGVPAFALGLSLLRQR